MDQSPHKTIKLLLEEKTGARLQDLGFGSGFLDVAPNTRAAKEKIGKRTSPKLQVFCKTGHYQESENTIYRLGENTYKSHWIGV